MSDHIKDRVDRDEDRDDDSNDFKTSHIGWENSLANLKVI
jgi:hypothetical protein